MGSRIIVAAAELRALGAQVERVDLIDLIIVKSFPNRTTHESISRRDVSPARSKTPRRLA